MRRIPLGLPLVLLVLSACEVPAFQGPAVQAVPDGFLRQTGAAQDHEVFDRPIIFADAFTRFGSDFSGMYVRGYAGTSTRRQVEEAIERARATDGSGELIQMTYLPVEDLTVDGQLSWGWFEETRDRNGLQYLEYRLVVPYDTVTYTVEFPTGDPALKIRPDSLRAIATSFAIGKTEYDFGLIGLGSLIALFVGGYLWKRVTPTGPRTDYALISMPTADPDADQPALDVEAARSAAVELQEAEPPPAVEPPADHGTSPAGDGEPGPRTPEG